MRSPIGAGARTSRDRSRPRPGRRSSRRLPGGRPADGIVLSAEGVGVHFGSRAILESVDISLRSGEMVALVGPNGAGKSTLLAILAGDLSPHRGRVELDGADIASWSPAELAMRRAVLLQQLTMTFPFTVRQTVEMGRAPWSGTDSERHDDARIRAAMEATEVTHLGQRTFTSLSGGERARAGLARVIAQDTSVLLLDEPTAALDVRHQERVLQLSRELARAGSTVVVVMHDLGLAAAHADRILVLAEGRIRADGPPVEVLADELLSEVYEHPIEVLTNPRSGELMVLPRRR